MYSHTIYLHHFADGSLTDWALLYIFCTTGAVDGVETRCEVAVLLFLLALLAIGVLLLLGRMAQLAFVVGIRPPKPEEHSILDSSRSLQQAPRTICGIHVLKVPLAPTKRYSSMQCTQGSVECHADLALRPSSNEYLLQASETEAIGAIFSFYHLQIDPFWAGLYTKLIAPHFYHHLFLQLYFALYLDPCFCVCDGREKVKWLLINYLAVPIGHIGVCGLDLIITVPPKLTPSSLELIAGDTTGVTFRNYEFICWHFRLLAISTLLISEGTVLRWIGLRRLFAVHMLIISWWFFLE